MLRVKIIDFLGNTNIDKWLSFFNDSQYWEKNRILVHQKVLLKELVKHCYTNVPYYANLFKQLKLHPSDFKDQQDLLKLPILRKEDVKKVPYKFIAKNLNSFNPVRKRTGGSTGVPFEYYNDRELRSIQWALKYRSWGWGGYKPGDKIAVMGGGSLFPHEKKSFKHLLRNSLNNFYKLPMTHFSKSMVDEYAATIEKNNISFIRGYPSAIATFAELNTNQNISIKGVFTTAEVLISEYKHAIENGLQTRVFDQYGCADAGAHASECEAHNGLHIHDEITISEIVKDNQPVDKGEEGELIFTSLYNYSMPLLRYAPEDLAKESYMFCACGRQTKLLKYISGRTSDIIEFKNGIRIAGPALTLIFSRVNVEKYQVVQHSWHELEIIIIPAPNFSNTDMKLIKSSFEIHCGEGVSITITKVNKIELPPSGKFRFIISKIKKQ